MELWDSILSSVQKRISNQNFDTWFRPTLCQKYEVKKNRLHVRVPNNHFKHWLADHYSGVISDAQRELNIENLQIIFQVDKKDTVLRQVDVLQEANRELRTTQRLPALDTDTSLSNLNVKYNFGSFVVGLSNQLAHAASLAVAERPSKAYNPLFIYGGVGLGKTHLMHAIGHYIKKRSPGVRLTYMSSERFVNELINSIRYDKMLQFRQKYRNIDILLVG